MIIHYQECQKKHWTFIANPRWDSTTEWSHKKRCVPLPGGPKTNKKQTDNDKSDENSKEKDKSKEMENGKSDDKMNCNDKSKEEKKEDSNDKDGKGEPSEELARETEKLLSLKEESVESKTENGNSQDGSVRPKVCKPTGEKEAKKKGKEEQKGGKKGKEGGKPPEAAMKGLQDAADKAGLNLTNVIYKPSMEQIVAHMFKDYM